MQVCPKQCITLKEDREGFLYPLVNASICVDCGLCEKTCPVINQGTPHEPISVYAAVNPDEEIRRQSSSGGIFTLLAETVIADNGVVFGARFDKHWNVVHDYTETLEGLAAFRGSKYVQSRIGNAYSQTEQFLKAGRKVMFTGTPCQVNGLKQFLRKEYANLLAVDFVCHGVPGPKVWRKYLDEEVARLCDKNSVSSHHISSFPDRDTLVKSISFRNKALGWKKYSFVLTLSKASAAGEQNTVSYSSLFYDNAYMQAFLANLSLRPSCYNCPAKEEKSGSDITIGDYWGVENVKPNIDDDKGCSLVILNTKKGNNKFQTLNTKKQKTFYQEAQKANPSIKLSVQEPPYRKLFMLLYRYLGFKITLKLAFSIRLICRVFERMGFI